MKFSEFFFDSRNIVTLLAGGLAVIAGIKYYLSDYANQLPTFLKYAISTVVGAGILVYWLMLSPPTKDEKTSVARVDENEIIGK